MRLRIRPDTPDGGRYRYRRRPQLRCGRSGLCRPSSSAPPAQAERYVVRWCSVPRPGLASPRAARIPALRGNQGSVFTRKYRRSRFTPPRGKGRLSLDDGGRPRPSEAAATLLRSTLIGYLPCRECGLLLSSEQRPRHVCSPEDSVAHQMTKVRVQLTALEGELAQFLETSAGKFALFLAERQTPI